MKYSIFGFRQDILVSLQRKEVVKDKEKVQKVDVIDLLILQEVADFVNRKNLIKYTIDNQDFFSIRYDTIINDLPILDIKKQALADRINKLCLFGLLEKKTIKNEMGSWTAFRIGENYEKLKYSDDEGGCVSKQGGAYQNTDGVRSQIQTGCVSNYTPKDSSTIKDTSTIKNNITKGKDDVDEVTRLFEIWWDMYDKKVERKDAEAKWKKLTDEERRLAIEHTPKYVAATPDKQFRKHPLTYINKKCWNDEIIAKPIDMFDVNYGVAHHEDDPDRYKKMRKW